MATNSSSSSPQLTSSSVDNNNSNYISSISQLRTLSTALSNFHRRYDELQQHLLFIQTTIDSKLPTSSIAASSSSSLPIINVTPEKTKPLFLVSQTNPNGDDNNNNNNNNSSDFEPFTPTTCGRTLRRFIVSHLSDVEKLRTEVPKALKLSANPAKMVMECFGKFYLQGRRAYTKDSPMVSGREASILVLEYFLLMENDGGGGVVIGDEVKQEAYSAAVAWRKRLWSEGGLYRACEADARGLLLLISCYGIPPVFQIQDIIDLIRSCNINRISAALRCSPHLLAKIPDCIQLGFLPRNIAKWVAPLSDAGLFSFSAYIYRKDVLTSALEGSNKKLTLILYVSQGPSFADMSGVTQPSLVSAICSLIAVIQRSSGLWRLQEVLGHYRWPETLETDFIFGSSSIGSVNAQFLAAFSAAVGKRSMQLSESEESDPDWGCWSISQESRNPSIKIIYPTIERVKHASCGILASKYLLCFSEKTWLRLRNVGILHDAIPDPIERVGHPMHVKVGLRRFQSKTSASSCGWVYCGSHNFSAAAWGRPLSYKRPGGVGRINDVLGSRLHISNYEVGVVFIAPPSDTLDHVHKPKANLDDIVLPFVIPAPKYKAMDRPATAKAMREALAELSELEKQRSYHEEILEELMEEEVPDEEEEVPEAADYVPVEKEEEKAYAEQLWIQVDSSQSC